MRRVVVRGCAAAYGALLTLYPQPFRRAYGPEMLRTFRRQCAEAAEQRGVLPVAWIFIHASWDLVRSVLSDG